MTTLLTTLFNKKRGKTKKIGQIIKYDKNPTFWLKIGILSTFHLAGGERFELSTNGFGDHYSTVEPPPFEKDKTIILKIKEIVKKNCKISCKLLNFYYIIKML